MTREEYKSIYEVVGAAQEVHKTLGRGLSEPIYQEALAIEMNERFACCCPADKLTSFISHYLLLSPPIY